jgi:hypothetical protein
VEVDRWPEKNAKKRLSGGEVMVMLPILLTKPWTHISWIDREHGGSLNSIGSLLYQNLPRSPVIPLVISVWIPIVAIRVGIPIVAVIYVWISTFAIVDVWIPILTIVGVCWVAVSAVIAGWIHIIILGIPTVVVGIARR